MEKVITIFLSLALCISILGGNCLESNASSAAWSLYVSPGGATSITGNVKGR